MNGSRTSSRLLGTLAVALVFAGSLELSASAGQKKKAPETYAVVAGTVFRGSGFALPGAEVVLTRDVPVEGKRKADKVKVISNERGEFAFRVPAEPAKYVVSVSLKGFRPEQKSVNVQAEERVEVTFSLHEESK